MAGIKITLDKERTIQFDYNAMVAIEQETGVSLVDLQAALKRLKLTHIRAFLWAGLRLEDPDLTIEEAGRMLTAKNSGEVFAACIKALKDFFV